MAEIALYLKLWLWGNFFALAGGCALTVAVGWFEKWKRKEISIRLYVYAVIIMLFMAAYKTWRDEYSVVGALNAKLSTPNLVPTFDRFLRAPAGPDDNGSVVTAIATLTNPIGPASIAMNWKLFVHLGNGKVIQGEETALPAIGPVRLGLLNQPEILVLKESDYWPVLGQSQPIPTGGGRSGWYQAYFQNVSMTEYSKHGTHLRLEFSDVTKKSYSCETDDLASVSQVVTPLNTPERLQPREHRK